MGWPLLFLTITFRNIFGQLHKYWWSIGILTYSILNYWPLRKHSFVLLKGVLARRGTTTCLSLSCSNISFLWRPFRSPTDSSQRYLRLDIIFAFINQMIYKNTADIIMSVAVKIKITFQTSIKKEQTRLKINIDLRNHFNLKAQEYTCKMLLFLCFYLSTDFSIAYWETPLMLRPLLDSLIWKTLILFLWICLMANSCCFN